MLFTHKRLDIAPKCNKIATLGRPDFQGGEYFIDDSPVLKEQIVQRRIQVCFLNPYCASDTDPVLKAGFDVRHCVIGAGVYALDLLMIARYFKRIGDHGTNIHKACRKM